MHVIHDDGTLIDGFYCTHFLFLFPCVDALMFLFLRSTLLYLIPILSYLHMSSPFFIATHAQTIESAPFRLTDKVYTYVYIFFNSSIFSLASDLPISEISPTGTPFCFSNTFKKPFCLSVAGSAPVVQFSG